MVIDGVSMDVRRTNQPAGTERAASLVEYTLLIVLIAVVCIGAVAAFGGGVDDNLDSTTTALTP